MSETINTEAYRARNEHRKTIEHQHCHGRGPVLAAASTDIDALLAEVERLRGAIDSQNDRIQRLSYAAYPPNHSGE